MVDESNLQRQIIHGQSDVGRSKAQSAREAMLEVNPLIDVRLHEFRLEPDNAVALFAEYDLILDGTDNFATRYLVNDAAVLAGKPYVWGSIYRFAGQASVFWEDAPDGRASTIATCTPTRRRPGWCPVRRGWRAGHVVRNRRLGDGDRGDQADRRDRRAAAGPASSTTHWR
jgi:adenylyltransferase/sulfurtransferase